MDQPKAEPSFIPMVLKDNQGAMAVIAHVTRLLSVWGAIERAEPPPMPIFRVAMWGAVIDLSTVQFYQQHVSSLRPLIGTAMLDLIAACDLESGEHVERALAAAFNARQSWCNLLQHCALLVGGVEWAMQHSAAIRAFANEQTYAEYLADVARPIEIPDVADPWAWTP